MIRGQIQNPSLLENRRKQITKIATRLYAIKGYDSVGIREIADECGLTTGALYRYIGSKDDIFHLILSFTPMFIDQLRQYSDSIPSTDFKNKLEKCIVYYISYCDREAERLLFFNRDISRFSHEDRTSLLQAQVDHVDFFEQLLIEGNTVGIINVRHPKALAHNILMLGYDWAVRRWYLRRHFTLQQYIDENIEMIFSIIRKNMNYTALK